ncbi:MAG: beta-lactamase family protein [Gemmatimonadota bacterium]|nr:beta-lactamase family protein [Gemmatimonadota bacterium]
MRVAERAGFSGAVRVERDGQVLLDAGYGLANRAEHVAFTPATVVQIGSNTKDFTAVAILQLQEKGRLSLSDSIGKYFPRAPADKRNITIQQLMDHRAGLPPNLGGDFDPFDRATLVDSAMRTPLIYAPGTREAYSNTGFSLLAAIIEHVTGESYDIYVRSAILKPLGLTRTGFLLPGFKSSEIAHGYRADGRDNGTMLAKPHAADGPYWNLRGNGGMLSTVDDMHTFYTALFESDRLMTPATRALRFNPHEPIGLAGSDGVSFFLYDRFPGMRTEIIIASTNATMQAPRIRRELGLVLGLPNPEDGPDSELAHRTGAKPAPAAIAALLNEFVAMLNAGDAAKLRAFISSHFDSDPNSPALDDRVQRFVRMHDNAGGITIDRITTYDTGPVEIAVTTQNEGTALILVNIDTAPPYSIHAMQVRLGN